MKTQVVNPQRGNRPVPTDKPKMEKILRARCKAELKELVERAANMLQLDEADVIRIGAQRYAAQVVYQPSALGTA